MDKNSNERPIAVMDSGVGGISVLRLLRKTLPHENYIFLCDTLHVPYGVKSAEEVRQITIGNVEFLISRGAKAVIIACNTATSVAAEELRHMYPKMPIIGIEPALKPAVQVKLHPHIIVMATPLTLQQEKFIALMEKYSDQAQITPLPCPELVELVERGQVNGPEAENCLRRIFLPYQVKDIDGVVLGCTHFSHLRGAIERVLGTTPIFDGNVGTARETARRLHEAGLLNSSDAEGTMELISTRGSAEDIALCQLLLRQ